ncbi:YcgL domain-containing protein [Aliikangiella coralliicola]|uniref:YcgL domain-containing protein FLL46_24720 n=1 Tax=Aliikangiella coralliicola TaxID=2592383 RepID=A0A545U0I6_9GAMM|nr:YcgL domain-containing protein [Aliikangiella coralliicola]TQV82978.1 YcgL domain-containing protein [Aliikangiella coralliicola]
MLASIYRSKKKDEMYLYVPVKDDFSAVPEALLKAFGKPEFALQINLAKRDKLSRVDIEEVKLKMEADGYFLQMPPVIHSNQADNK